MGTLNDLGNIIVSRNGGTLTANTLYKDTVTLANGCYTIELTDSGEDGLSFWANPSQGSGYLRLRKVTPSALIKTYPSDCGGQIYQQFTVGLTSNVDDYSLTENTSFNVYPNPTDGHVNIDINLTSKEDGIVEIVDVLGKSIYHHEFKSLSAESIEVDLSHLRSGVYFVSFKSGKEAMTRKLVIR